MQMSNGSRRRHRNLESPNNLEQNQICLTQGENLSIFTEIELLNPFIVRLRHSLFSNLIQAHRGVLVYEPNFFYLFPRFLLKKVTNY